MKNKFGDKFRIGEWGAMMNLYGEEDPVDGNFSERMNYIISNNITEAYVFCYKEFDNNPSEKTWGLFTESTDQPKPSYEMLNNYFS